ncbi:hypothetical protein [Virgisporangium aurantiacum]|uniref:Uncharacterized protein n=1 Tax=Virgisporangium aurantiacum TaxID=175570 RepID=A0A8J3ZEK2_9ACTN|nr:hypothetical protein [Virgisporangium aurantiacum]GIJ60360.1 hypothetical protein Vau01_078760 [Virgisporangium aurantiacum]
MTNIARNRSLFRRLGTILLASGIVVPGLVLVAAPAQALPLTVAVTITRVGECCPGGPIDLTSDADFYGRTTIGTTSTSFGEITDRSLITPNWRATASTEHTAATVSVKIEIFDEDDGLNFDDNRIDLTSNDSDRDVNITVDLHPVDRDCTFSGDVSGSCNQVVQTNGNADDGDVAGIEFKVEVTEPAQAPGRHVRCGHAPLWPQAGQQVRITAESFGDQPDGQALPTLLADRVEVWYSTDGGATRQIVGSSGRQTTFNTTRIAPGNGATISYGCRVVDAGVPVYSGWRTVQVGNPPQGQAVPVLLNSDREHALDIVLFPATVRAPQNPANPGGGLLNFPVYAAGAADANFQTHAAAAIAELYREQIVLDNQRAINVWLARDGASTGGIRDLDGNGALETCQHTLPDNTGRDYGFGNVKAILHPMTPFPGDINTLRECAVGGVFSAEAGEPDAFIHETGHAGWGLADEYPFGVDYFQPNPYPNIYLSLDACTADVGNLNGVAADCRGMDTARDADTDPDIWISDPATNDLMADNQFARRADRRRMKYVFELCDQAKC